MIKGWHLAILVLIAYVVGVKYPGIGQSALSKIGW